MNSIEYIKKNIDILVNKYSDIKCRYEADTLSGSHYLEISSSNGGKNELLLNSEIELLSNFISIFPYETLTFLQKDDLFTITSPTYIKEGIDFDEARVNVPSYRLNNVLSTTANIIKSVGL